jgi:hypothetical protein
MYTQMKWHDAALINNELKTKSSLNEIMKHDYKCWN